MDTVTLQILATALVAVITTTVGAYVTLRKAKIDRETAIQNAHDDLITQFRTELRSTREERDQLKRRTNAAEDEIQKLKRQNAGQKEQIERLERQLADMKSKVGGPRR
jgi:chromosome segregation ATPase